MRKTRKSLIGLAALTVFVGTGIAGSALGADIRFDATLNAPNASVRISNIPCGHCRSYSHRDVVVHKHNYLEINKRDQRIARRLAMFTGVPKREMIRLRRHGHNWFEIGRWLRVPSPVVRAAMHQKSWNRFLHEERRNASHRRGKYGKRRVEYYDYSYRR